MVKYVIGQRVKIYSPYAPLYISPLDGHTCRIKSMDASIVNDDVLYTLEWRQEDNPGRELIIPIDDFIWGEWELAPIASHASAVSFDGLPDV